MNIYINKRGSFAIYLPKVKKKHKNLKVKMSNKFRRTTIRKNSTLEKALFNSTLENDRFARRSTIRDKRFFCISAFF